MLLFYRCSSSYFDFPLLIRISKIQFFLPAIYRDRFRTAVNVLGDAYGAGIVEHLSRNDIVKVPEVEIEVPKEQRNGFHNPESGKDKMDTRM